MKNSTSIIRTIEDKCAGCNKCISKCPVQANIAYNLNGKNKIKVDDDRCIQCGECITVCDHEAREYADDTQEFIKALQRGNHIAVIAAPAVRFLYPDYRFLFGWLKSLGVRLIYDVSLGADIATWAYLKTMSQLRLPGIISQTCPTIVNYVEKYQPQLIEKLAPVQSPMMCTAIYMKDYLSIQGEIAFLSPCIGKISEIREESTANRVQYNVTLRKLNDYWRSRNIDLSCYSPAEYDRTGCGLGMIVSRPGGLRENIENYAPDTWIRQVEGAEHTYEYLTEYAERLQQGKAVPQVVDVLHCYKGCNVGTGTEQDVSMDDISGQMDRLKHRQIQSAERTLFHRFERELALHDFLRQYQDKSHLVRRAEISAADLEAVFRRQHKYSEESRKVNCFSCGYGSCEQFARSVAAGTNHLENCIDYNRQEVELEKERLISEIRQRKMAEEAAQAEKEKYRALLKQSTEAKAIGDMETKRFLEVNESFLRMTGYSAEGIRRVTAAEFFNESPEQVDQFIKEAFLSSPGLLWIRRGDGRMMEVECTASLIRYGSCELALITLRDLTEERRQHRNTQKQLMLAGMVQRGMLQPDCSEALADVRQVYQSYHSVSGDFCSYKWVENRSVLRGYVLDVTGHGMSAALQASAIAVLLNRRMEKFRGVTMQAFADLNREVGPYFSDGSFAAIISFEFDFNRKTLTYGSGGINKFLAFSRHIKGCVHIPGMYLGITDDPEFTVVTIPIQSGDAFYFLSDGLSEMLPDNIMGESLDDFEATVAILQAEAENELRWDDCTALCVKVK